VFLKTQGAHLFLESSGGEPFQTRDHQPVFRMSRAEVAERLDSSLQVLVGMQSGNHQNEWPGGASGSTVLPALFGDLKECGIDAMRDGSDLTLSPRKPLSEIPRGIVRNGDQSTGARRGACKQHVPERKIPDAKELGVDFVLQVVEYRDLRAASEQGRGEAGIQQNINVMASEHSRQAGLFEENARGPETRPNRAADAAKPRACGDQVTTCFTIQEDDIIVCFIDTGQRAQEKPEVDLRASHAAGDEKQSVDADAQGHYGSISSVGV